MDSEENKHNNAKFDSKVLSNLYDYKIKPRPKLQ